MEQILRDMIALTGLEQQDYDILQLSHSYTQQWVEEFTQVFYETLYGYESTAKVFREGERPHREETLRRWYLEVTSGICDDPFWQRQWIIGLVHVPRRVTDPFMIGMMSRVQQLFLDKCLHEPGMAQPGRVYLAFKRVTDVITGLIAEGYFISYVEATERMTGQNRSLTDRLVELEINRMVEEARAKL
ncbi:MAG: hypothetical protein HC837_11105 [Chloroflexaceae bacterium]|nr:hypothetical protein [Chloroflexaceae bacterium]